MNFHKQNTFPKVHTKSTRHFKIKSWKFLFWLFLTVGQHVLKSSFLKSMICWCFCCASCSYCECTRADSMLPMIWSRVLYFEQNFYYHKCKTRMSQPSDSIHFFQLFHDWDIYQFQETAVPKVVALSLTVDAVQFSVDWLQESADLVTVKASVAWLSCFEKADSESMAADEGWKWVKNIQNQWQQMRVENESKTKRLLGVEGLGWWVTLSRRKVEDGQLLKYRSFLDACFTTSFYVSYCWPPYLVT